MCIQVDQHEWDLCFCIVALRLGCYYVDSDVRHRRPILSNRLLKTSIYTTFSQHKFWREDDSQPSLHHTLIQNVSRIQDTAGFLIHRNRAELWIMPIGYSSCWTDHHLLVIYKRSCCMPITFTLVICKWTPMKELKVSLVTERNWVFHVQSHWIEVNYLWPHKSGKVSRHRRWDVRSLSIFVDLCRNFKTNCVIWKDRRFQVFSRRGHWKIIRWQFSPTAAYS